MSDADDQRWMRLAVELAWQCPPSPTAYSVGAVIVGADGTELSRGFSREGDPVVHAEESALGKLSPGDPRLPSATLYSTLEPCSQRKSGPRTCTQLIVAAGLRRVVIAWREPALFVADCEGYELLTEAGIIVTELPGFAAQAAAPNKHLVPPPGETPQHLSRLSCWDIVESYQRVDSYQNHRAWGIAWQFDDSVIKGQVMETTTFTALCERAGRWWTIRVSQIEGLTAQVRSLDQAEMMARQSIARALGIPPETIRVELLPDAPAPVAHALEARRAARQAVETATQATREALDALARDGYAFHDAATMLALSPAEVERYGPVPPVPAHRGDPSPVNADPFQLAGP